MIGDHTLGSIGTQVIPQGRVGNSLRQRRVLQVTTPQGLVDVVLIRRLLLAVFSHRTAGEFVSHPQEEVGNRPGWSDHHLPDVVVVVPTDAFSCEQQILTLEEWQRDRRERPQVDDVGIRHQERAAPATRPSSDESQFVEHVLIKPRRTEVGIPLSAA